MPYSHVDSLETEICPVVHFAWKWNIQFYMLISVSILLGLKVTSLDKDVIYIIYLSIFTHTHTHIYINTSHNIPLCVYIYTYIMEYYSTIKKNKIMPFAATWMDLKIIILK